MASLLCMAATAFAEEGERQAREGQDATGPDSKSGAGQESTESTLSPEDLALFQELEATSGSSTASAVATAPAGGSQKAAGGAFSNLYNPALSLNGLFLAAGSGDLGNAEATEESGASAEGEEDEEATTALAIQEVELQFTSNVDPYFSANLMLSMEGGEGLEVEEGYLTLTPKPAGLAFRAGKIKAPFGRENIKHTHALPFIDKSLIGEAVFGETGLNEVGIEASWLPPLPWYCLLAASVQNGDNALLFDSPNWYDLAGFMGLKNVMDLGDSATLEAGLSYVAGRNSDETLSQVAGGHLVFKWRPLRNASRRSAVLSLEALYSDRPVGSSSRIVSGLNTYAQWQLSKRWFVAGRFDYFRPSQDSEGETRESAILAVAPTEFSAIRLQLNLQGAPNSNDLNFESFLQFNFTLGAHPAHAY